MILAGDEAQAQFATVGVRLPQSDPHGGFASLGAVSLSGTRHSRAQFPTPCERRRAGKFIPPASGGHALMTPSRVCLIPIRIRCQNNMAPTE